MTVMKFQSSAPADDIGWSSAEFAPLVGELPSTVTSHVRRHLRRLMEEMTSLRQELRAARARVAELEKLADTDVLTPVANRRSFERALVRAVSFCERHKIPAALLFIDLNDLKAINDAHGHPVGDAAILHVANMLIDNVRVSDVVGRLGGDEFGVVLYHADAEQAQAKAAQLADAIRARPIAIDGMDLRVSVAIGAYPLGPGDTPQAVLARADAAMYAAKRRIA